MRKFWLVAAGAVIPMLGQTSIQSLAQSKGVIVSGEYQPRYPIRVSHGQILTVTVAGLGDDIAARIRAESIPLPKELGGISAVIYQADRFDAPILQVEPLWTCPFRFTAPLARGEKCGTLLAVTLQIPFELDRLRGPFGPPDLPPQLVIYYKGLAGAAVDLQVDFDAVRLLRACDLAVRNPITTSTTTLNCDYAVVVHSDGSRITRSNPAREGEMITAFAFGLGWVAGAPPSGRPASAPIAVQGFAVTYAFGSEPSAFRSAPRVPMAAKLETDFIGLSTGAAGLYQINFRVPKVPGDLVDCRGAPEWNFTVAVTGSRSSDWAGLCVEPAKSAQ